MSIDDYHSSGRDAIIIGLTANLYSAPRYGDYILSDWQQAGLRSPTKSRCTIATVDRSAIRQSLGNLSEDDLAKITQSLADVLGVQV